MNCVIRRHDQLVLRCARAIVSQLKSSLSEESIRHEPIGRPSNSRISDGDRDYAVTLVRER
ncbi:hypothetical protein ASE23_21485 [Rhizobium sp. Root73]|nr:hypothetical protein ASD36_27550 [Rhizobium sp. Root1334]KRC12538.1 hypothetical protein ASE23_21485 [Rhizobium sp. Root73]